MRITILTAGTRGDTQPYIALGIGLQRAGHRVCLVAGENYQEQVRQYGLEFQTIHVDFAALMDNPLAQDVMKKGASVGALIAQLKASRTASPFARIQEDIWQASQDSEAILFAPGMPNGYFIAKYLRIPCAALNAVPMSPTRTQPAVFFPPKPRLGGIYNQLTHTLLEQGFWQGFRPTIQKFWAARSKDLSTPIRIPFGAPNRRQRAERMPFLYGYSEHVLPRPKDWRASEFVTGYWFLDNEPAWQPSEALVDFLRSGPPPVYVGFGSMRIADSTDETTELVIDALQRTGQRGILATGWNGLSNKSRLPDTILMVDSLPHNWLFPKVAAVVHHGGAGTTAAGLRAGVPSVIIPHGVDQPMWGKRVATLGVGPQPIPRKQLTAERLAEAISATADPSMRTRAEALGQKIRSEDGVTRAVEILDDYFRRYN